MTKEPIKGLVFYEKSHRYKLDGQWVPGVTTILNQGMPKDFLKYWAARTVAEYVADNLDTIKRLYTMGRAPMVAALKEVPFQKRDDAGVRGTEVHDLAERLTHGEPVEVPAHIEGYVQACVDFLDDWKPKPLIVERPVGHRAHGWAGKPDLIAELPDGRVVLFDWKTADSGIFPETAYQLCAYSRAEFYTDEDGTEHVMPGIDACYAVWLQPGGYEVYPLVATDEVYEEFLHAKEVAAACKRAKGNQTTAGYVGQPVPPPGSEEAA
jgi:hypothetical protein